MQPQESQAQEKLYENGTIWITSVSSWSGKDKLTAEDLGKDPDDILDIIELGRKSLIPEDVRIRMKRPASQINSLMTAIGARKFFIRGAWWVENNKFMQAKVGMEKIREDQGVVVEDLAANFDEIQAEMIEKYPVLSDAKWPTEKQLRNRFGVKWHVCEIRGAEVNEADPQDLMEAKMEFRNELNKTYQEYSDQIMAQARTAMIEAIKEISKKIQEGQKITEGNLKKPRKVVDDYLNIAGIFDMNDVKRKIEELKAAMDNTDAGSIRDSWAFANNFAMSIKGMAENIGEMTGLSSDGSVKRRIKLDKAA